MAFYDPAMFEVHVLLVDQDMNALFETARLLQFNSYRVTPVHDAVVASALLSTQGNARFNVVIVDVKTSNIQGFKLVHEAINIDLPVIVMSSSASPTLVKCAIEDGAFLFMQKPIAGDELKYLWQHILRETTRKRASQKGKSLSSNINYNHKNNCCHMSRGENFELGRTSEMNNPIAYANNLICQRGGGIVTFGSDSTINNYNNHQCMGMKPKMCTEWTPELHDKFMAAVKLLGDGRCFPKDILELMNVPGLTRMQVASHLQKCRHGWQPTKDRQGRRPKGNQSRSVKKYGIFPRLVRGCQPLLPPPPPPPEDNNNNSQQQQVNDHVVADHHVLTTTSSSCNSVEIDNISLPAAITTQQPAAAGTWEQAIVSQNELAAPDHLLPFDFAAEDDDTLIPNNFNINEFDFDQTFLGQASDDGGDAVSASFWSTWIANFAREL